MEEIRKEPFTNNLGQTINPGDKIVIATKGYGGDHNIRLGVYLGVRKNKYGKDSVIALSTVEKQGYKDLAGNTAKWNHDRYMAGEIRHSKLVYERQVALRSNRIYPTSY